MLEKALASDDGNAIQQASKRLLDASNGATPCGAPATLLQASIWLLSHQKQAEGVLLAERAAFAYPDDLPLTVLLADLLLQQKKDEQSINLLRGFTERNPHNNEAKAEAGMVFLRCGRQAEALKAFESIPEDGRTPIIRFTYAQALNSARKQAEAEKQLRQAIKDDPEYAEARQLLALTLEDRGLRAEAQEIYEALLKESSRNVSARLLYLRSLLNDSNLDKAAAILVDAPDPGRFTVSSIAMLIDEKQADLAERFLNRLEEIKDLPPVVSYYHAAFLVESGKDSEKALKLLDRVDSSSENYEDSIRLRMRVYSRQGNQPAQLRMVELLRKLHPEDIEPDLYAAEILCTQNRYAEAESILSAALAKHPSDSRAAFQAAYLKELEGKHAKAVMLMEDVLRRFPDCVPALNFIGYKLADENKDLDRALALLTRAVELSPDSDFILDSMAWVLYRLGRHEEAWNFISKAIAIGTRSGTLDPTILEHSGDIAMALGKTAEARNAWKKAYGLLDVQADPEAARRLLNKTEGGKR